MDLKTKYLSETCSDPIEYLNQLRQTTEPIGEGTIYSEEGELVEYEVAIKAVRKANDAFIEKACSYIRLHSALLDTENNDCMIEWLDKFRNVMKK